MAIAIHRMLTLKSKLGFGNYGDYTVKRLLSLDRHLILVHAYYCISNINYVEEVLEQLKLTPTYQISKPGTDKQNFKLMIERQFPGAYRRKYIDEKSYLEKTLRRGSKLDSKSTLQYKNQGK